MRELKIKFIVFIKELVFKIKPHIWLGWLEPGLLKMYNTIGLSRYLASHTKDMLYNDYYVSDRDYSRRYNLYNKISSAYNLAAESVLYLEFGVSTGNSFNWWIEHNQNPSSRFYGFDTFQGLPEQWGVFKKGDLSSEPPELKDPRAKFIKGLFQDTLPDFIKHQPIGDMRKIIHLDADLFSATLYVLTNLGSSLRKGDVLIFDEFNVPNHEYFAFKVFCSAFYIKPKLIAAVNNYYEVAMIIE